MLDMALDNAIADHKTYGNIELQHRLFARLRREDPIHWTEPTGYRPFWTVTKYADIIEIERQADASSTRRAQSSSASTSRARSERP